MSKNKQIAAVRYSIAIKALIDNLDAINDRITLKLEEPNLDTWFDLYNDGANIQCRGFGKDSKIGFSQDSWLNGVEFFTKLGSRGKPINKRVLNDIQVWFHREYSDALAKFKEDLEYHVGDVTVRKQIDQFTVMDRLTGKNHDVSDVARGSVIGSLVDVEVRCVRSVFNKATLTVSVQSKADYSKVPAHRVPIMAKLVPVAPGVLKQFSCHYKHEPVNQYVQEVVKEYFNSHL